MGSEGPKIFRGTDSNSTLVVTPPSKPQRRPTIILRKLIFCEITLCKSQNYTRMITVQQKFRGFTVFIGKSHTDFT